MLMLITTIVENYFNKYQIFVRFLLVGIVNTFVGISVILFMLNIVGFTYWKATFIGNSIGAIASYFLNKSFTFKSKISNRRGFISFIAVILLSYLISYQFAYRIVQSSVFLNQIVYKDELAILLATGIYTILNYLGQKHLIFR